MKKIKVLTLSTLMALTVFSVSVNAQDPKLIKTAEYKAAIPLDLVSHSQNYLNQKIKITATFDKFSTLGLDYKPALRDSQNYISFLIKRDDVTDHTIPLSEMKILIKRSIAEKNLLNIESGDKIEFTGKVFSCALGDPWIEVDDIKLLTVKPKKVEKNKK